MEPTRIIDSFNYAIEGFIYVLKTQRNMRIHFLLGVLLFILALVVDFNKLELVCLGSIVTLVLFAEMINTTIEHAIDLISSDVHPLARIIKDISAGAVLLTAIAATISGYLLFSEHLDFSIVKGLGALRYATPTITVIAIILVLSLVILGKVLFHSGTPLRGGMPSGHSAVAFSLWTIIAFSTSNTLVIILSFALAVLIALSRLSQQIHTLWEIIMGAFVGFLVTVLCIQLFK